MREKLEIFPYFGSNEVCDSGPNFVWVHHLTVSGLPGLLFCFLSTVFYLHGGFPQITLFIGMLQDFSFRGL